MTNLTDDGRDRGRAKGNPKQADAAINDYWDLLPDLYRLRACCLTLRQIADRFNANGWRTRKGTPWSQVQVKRLLDRTEGKLEFVVQRRRNRSGWYDWQGGFDRYLDALYACRDLSLEEYSITVYSRETPNAEQA